MYKPYIRSDMQLLIIILALGLSSLYLGRRIWKQFSKKNSSCEGCALHQTLTKELQAYGKRSIV